MAKIMKTVIKYKFIDKGRCSDRPRYSVYAKSLEDAVNKVAKTLGKNGQAFLKNISENVYYVQFDEEILCNTAK